MSQSLHGSVLRAVVLLIVCSGFAGEGRAGCCPTSIVAETQLDGSDYISWLGADELGGVYALALDLSGAPSDVTRRLLVSRDRGDTWEVSSAPEVLAATAGYLSVGVSASGELVMAYPEDGVLFISSSPDQGRTFTAPVELDLAALPIVTQGPGSLMGVLWNGGAGPRRGHDRRRSHVVSCDPVEQESGPHDRVERPDHHRVADDRPRGLGGARRRRKHHPGLQVHRWRGCRGRLPNPCCAIVSKVRGSCSRRRPMSTFSSSSRCNELVGTTSSSMLRPMAA